MFSSGIKTGSTNTGEAFILAHAVNIEALGMASRNQTRMAARISTCSPIRFQPVSATKAARVKTEQKPIQSYDRKSQQSWRRQWCSSGNCLICQPRKPTTKRDRKGFKTSLRSWKVKCRPRSQLSGLLLPASKEAPLFPWFKIWCRFGSGLV